MKYYVYEDALFARLLPLTSTRPVYELRIGVFTFRERWEKVLSTPVRGICRSFFQAQDPEDSTSEPICWINGGLLPSPEILYFLSKMLPGDYLIDDSGELLVFCTYSWTKINIPLDPNEIQALQSNRQTLQDKQLVVRRLTDLVAFSQNAIAYDWNLLRALSRVPTHMDPHTLVYGADNLLVEPDVSIKAAIINAEDGPIYLGKNVQIQEGAIISGTHAIGLGSTVAMGAKLRGGSSIGPNCKVGGEIKNSILWGYANKGHDGYLGDSILGMGCNLGANTNTSNMKNNLGKVRQWSYRTNQFEDTGLQFVGLVMGDHSMAGINTMFNTGTVVGVCANVFGGGFPPKFIPDFSWGGEQGLTTHRFEEAWESAKAFMRLKKIELDETHKKLLQIIFDETHVYRKEPENDQSS